MLKLKVMHKIINLLLILPFISGWFSQNQQLDLVRLTSPKDGEILQGSIYIQGTISGSTFRYAKISFQYQESQSTNWFLIDTIETTVVDDTIAIWDTSTIADGKYRIRVVAFYENNQSQEAVLENLDIRNYTPVGPGENLDIGEMSTPSGNVQVVTEATSTSLPLPTKIPPNEMIVTGPQFFVTLLQGAAFGVLLLVVVLVFVIIRRRKLG